MLPEVSLLERAFAARVAMLQTLKIANNDPEPCFDRLVRIAAQATGTPIALITLLGADRQWIKAEIGFPATSTALTEAFCLHALASADLLEVPDATLDERFNDNPLVTGPEHIRFYAGYPIIFHGVPLGTVCVLDRVPRQLEDEARPILADLSGMVSDLLEIRYLQQSVNEEQLRLVGERVTRIAAEEASKNKSEFLSRVSHELRTPLNAILGFGQLLLLDEAAPLDPVQRDRVKIVHQAGEQLLSLVDDLLEISRIEQGALTLHRQPVKLRPLIDEVFKQAGPSAQAAQVSVHCSVGQAVIVLADERALRQVLSNLLSNAVKYNRPNGFVSAHAEDDAQHVVISVRDTGRGFTPEQLTGLFQPFNRLGAQDSAISGTGLGLVIARALVSAMGGDLSVESQAGAGSCVHVRLQRDTADG